MSAIKKSRKPKQTITNFFKENELLENTAQQNSRLREQINKQSHSDSIMQVKIQDKISYVKDKAIELAKSLQAEKRKNIELEAIIRNMNKLRQESRKIQADKNNNQENIDTSSRKLKKLEYSLEQLYSKTNNLTSKTKNRKTDVDTFRTQRVIDCNIFDKLEKQLKGYQIEYKKLLIQKIKLEKEYNQNLDNYGKIKKQINFDTTTNFKNSQTIRNSDIKKNGEDQFFNNAPQIHQAIKFTELNLQSVPKQQKKNSLNNSRRNLMPINNGHTNTSNFKKQSPTINKQRNQLYQCKLSKILLQTSLQNYEDLIDNIQNIEDTNIALYKQSNQINDQISDTKKQIQKIMNMISHKQVKYYPNCQDQNTATREQIQYEKHRKLVQKANKLLSQVNVEHQNMMSFIRSVQFRSLCKQLQENQDQNKQLQCLDEIETMIEKLQLHFLPKVKQYKQKKQSKVKQTLQIPQQQLQPKNSTKLKKLQQNQQNSESTARSNIEDLINKVKKMEPSEKIMNRQQFKKQYDHLRKNGACNKPQRAIKKNTTQMKKQRINGSLY